MAIALATAAYVVIEHGKGTAAAAPPAARVKTVAILKTDLSNAQSFTGTLGFGTPRH